MGRDFVSILSSFFVGQSLIVSRFLWNIVNSFVYFSLHVEKPIMKYMIN